jgi:hypothetical protein
MQVIAWALLQYTNVDMPAPVQMAGASIFSTVLAVMAAHYTPLGMPPPPGG